MMGVGGALPRRILFVMQQEELTVRLRLLTLAAAATLALSGCAFHSTAKDWNGLVGADGKPKYYRSTTKFGLNLLTFVPLVGNTDMPEMVDELTESIANDQGNQVRIVQGGADSYAYVFPPFTWILTPIKYEVAAEYTPESQGHAKDQEEIRRSETAESEYDPSKW